MPGKGRKNQDVYELTQQPPWFRKWLANDFAHLQETVANVERDARWSKWLLGFILSATLISTSGIIFAVVELLKFIFS